jgi:hypothetical protein
VTAREEAFRLVSTGLRTHDAAMIDESTEKHGEATRLMKEWSSKE